MRLHRLTLTNYRGIAHRDIEFADRGVTVVCGANEIGKSSMIEALDLLLESKDRSTKKDVKQVKPTHADVGSEVTADLSTGPYRFIYRKRFHKKCETELTVLAPVREQFTGDEAHERVRAMLAETVDTGLWQAQRVLQASSTSAVDLSGCDALSRALDVAASDASATSAGLAGGEPLLLDKIDGEYGRYFTPTGRPKGEWAAAVAALEEAEAEVAQRTAEVAEVEERVRTHATLSDDLAVLTEQAQDAARRLTEAAAAAEAVNALSAELRAAQSEATAVGATRAAASALLEERKRLCAGLITRQETVDTVAAAAEQAAEAEATSREVVQEAEQAAVVAEQQVQAVQSRAQAARQIVDRLAERAEADRLAALLIRYDAVCAERVDVNAELSQIMLTDSMFRDIETAASAVDRAQVRAEQTAAAIEFTADSDVELAVGSETITLMAGQTWSLSAAEAAEVALPGVLRVRVNPAASAVDTHATLAAAQEHLSDLLRAAVVDDVEAARSTLQRRRELIARRDQLTATLTGIVGHDDVEHLRSRLEALQETEAIDVDPDAARAELASADEALREAATQYELQRRVAAAAAKQLAEHTKQAAVCGDRLAVAREELAATTEQLATARAEVSDEVAAARAVETAQAAQVAEQKVAEVSARLTALAPEKVTAEFTRVRAESESLCRKRDDAARALRDIEVELAVFGTEGRTGKLDAAQIKREHAVAAYTRVHQRARAVTLLRSVMLRHRDDTRLRYVEPFRAEVERLGRTVFGETFEVEVDSDLTIRNRTLDGRTVPFESLSGGAKEQLGIVARLAVAGLVSDEDTVPVVIDDALGFSDPDRLAKMGAVFDQVGADGQVIVLTCSPERYLGVVGAHRVQLTA
ncbi:AAA family ATPase [Mycolicibacterium confluentis]|uniref:Endonuclease GajA/Old nuclease/RecF-like AAA domain-containing protein n=1 Tax=Mycolicibacterium confluentis TaxID=28047 RepID=A0A7I7XTC4_9MYCO|nr:AAA family ATPase [Mycolicibacterium confluentis]MCV7321150.1 AAA family ATPase [Mycolicibacterium confluentis]ORV21253.1 hypothetical protein AWB99_27000 [Mycolicibacterium confluentis]BBZ32374.1 hypothetical protein MCNF_09790 [Mycolicibacterium confluentis]